MDTTPPIQVEVTNHPEPKKFEVRAAYRSAVLTSANPVMQIAGYDPLRERIRFSPAVNAYVISGGISQATDGSNTAASIVNPNGRFMPSGTAEYVSEGQNEIWVSTGTFPTVIGYEIIRRVPE